MSNNVYIQTTIFCNVGLDGVRGEESYGIRVYDDYGSYYNNMLEMDEVGVYSVIELFNMVMCMFSDLGEEAAGPIGMIDWAFEEKDGLFINGEFYSVSSLTGK